MLGLLGSWARPGPGGYPTLAEDFAYAQEVTFSHDGRPFLHYEARAWLLDADGAPLRPSARESGWWRLQPDGRVEALITQPTGIAEILVGRAGGGKRSTSPPIRWLSPPPPRRSTPPAAATP